MNTTHQAGDSTPPPSEADAQISEKIDKASRQLELSDPDHGLGTIDRSVNKLAEFIGVAIFVTITCVIFVNAVLRYTSDSSIVWAEELVIGLTPWLAMVGLFLAIRRGSMIRIEFFFERFPAKFRRSAILMGQIWSSGVLAYLAWISFEYVSFFGKDLTPILGLQKGIFSSALIVGGVAGAIAFLVEARLDRRRG